MLSPLGLCGLLILGFCSASLPQNSVCIAADGATPPFSTDPHYVYPGASGGKINSSGEHGMAVILAGLNENKLWSFSTIQDEATVMQSTYFYREELKVQEYIVPPLGGSQGNSAPYGKRRIKIKLWGGGGGGCGGGRRKQLDPSLPRTDPITGETYYSTGLAGGFVEASLLVPINEKLSITLGGGGNTEGSQSSTLGGIGGFNGGLPGRDDGTSGGGGGGGLSSIKMNGTVLLAAFGGRGGGNTSYCTAGSGQGGRFFSPSLGGFIDEQWVAPVDESDWKCPSLPYATDISHDFASFTWNAGSNQYRHTSKDTQVDKYVVYLSKAHDKTQQNQRICWNIRDYMLHEHVTRSAVNGNSTAELKGLTPNSSYCLLVEGFSKEGLSLGRQVAHFTTKSEPTNNWRQERVQQSMAKSLEVNPDNDSSWCQQSKSLPSGRRGHSLSVVNDQVYLFGGATVKCICHFDPKHEKEKCFSENVFSDELWHYDSLSSEFTLLSAEDAENAPRGREQHSLTILPNKSIILIGGRGWSTEDTDMITSQDSSVLGDVWMLAAPHNITSHVVSGENDLIKLPVALKQGEAVEHKRTVSLNSLGFEASQDMCIRSLHLDVSMELNCTSDLDHISLTGNNRETKLFVSTANSRNYYCHNDTVRKKFTFSDDAVESLLAHPALPSGTFRPASSLSVYKGLSMAGEWTISITRSQTRHNMANNALLVDWKLHVDVQPCVAVARWKMLEPAFSIPPRHDHSAVAVGNSVYIRGGHSSGLLNDMWRLDVEETLTWTELKPPTTQKKLWPRQQGQATLLTPFGLLLYGGVETRRHEEREYDLLIYEFISGEWKTVPVASDSEFPYHRYRTSLGLMSQKSVPAAIMFGGDGGLLSNSYINSYGFTPNTFFDDLWTLSLEDPALSRPEGDKNQFCNWQLKSNSTFQQMWRKSCGWKIGDEESPLDCDWYDVLTMAWCLEQYQAV